MEDDEFLFLPGDCFRCQTPDSVKVAQVIRRLDYGSFSMHFWTTEYHAAQAGEPCNMKYYLPPILTSTNEDGIMDMPRTLTT
jgi:hypothetical protein